MSSSSLVFARKANKIVTRANTPMICKLHFVRCSHDKDGIMISLNRFFEEVFMATDSIGCKTLPTLVSDRSSCLPWSGFDRSCAVCLEGTMGGSGGTVDNLEGRSSSVIGVERSLPDIFKDVRDVCSLC